MHNHLYIREPSYKHKYWCSREYDLLSYSIFRNWSLRRDPIIPLVKLKNISSQFHLRSPYFYLAQLDSSLIWYHFFFFWKWRLCTPWSILIFIFLFIHSCLCIHFGVVSNVASEQHTFKNMNFGKRW